MRKMMFALAIVAMTMTTASAQAARARSIRRPPRLAPTNKSLARKNKSQDADPQRPKNNSRVFHEWSGTFIRTGEKAKN